MCRIGSGEPCFPARFTLRSRHFRLHPLTSSGLDDPVRLGVRLLRSCRSSHLFLTEFSAINPHPVQENSELTCDGIARFTSPIYAAFIIGLLEAFSIYIFGLYWAPAVLFLTMIIVLLIKPEGLFGKYQRTL